MYVRVQIIGNSSIPLASRASERASSGGGDHGPGERMLCYPLNKGAVVNSADSLRRNIIRVTLYVVHESRGII